MARTTIATRASPSYSRDVRVVCMCVYVCVYESNKSGQCVPKSALRYTILIRKQHMPRTNKLCERQPRCPLHRHSRQSLPYGRMRGYISFGRAHLHHSSSGGCPRTQVFFPYFNGRDCVWLVERAGACGEQAQCARWQLRQFQMHGNANLQQRPTVSVHTHKVFPFEILPFFNFYCFHYATTLVPCRSNHKLLIVKQTTLRYHKTLFC